MSNELIVQENKQTFSVDDIGRMAKAISASGLFGIKTVEQAAALMFISQAEGMHPAIAARDYHIIQGRPSLKADAILARFHNAGGTVKWHSLTDVIADATFSHPSGGEVRLTWEPKNAENAGLFFIESGKRMQKTANGTAVSNWQKYPRAMLRARLVSEGVRTVFPGCVCGVYEESEVREFTKTEAIDAEVSFTSIQQPTTQEPAK